MAHVHHDTGTTVVSERDPMSGVIIGLIVAAIVGFLIWLFAFSGVVFDRDTSGGGGSTRIEQNVGGNSGDTTGGGAGTAPQPTSS